MVATFFYGTIEYPTPPMPMAYNVKKDKWWVTFESANDLTMKPNMVKVCSPTTCVESTNIGGKK